jgi:outer membrane protein OmpA-like peptidoglycan-associated protein
MKKIFMFLVACMLSFTVVNAQYGPTKFTDNVTVEVRGGISTSMTEFLNYNSGVVGVGIEKYVTPWLGFGIDANTLFANPSGDKNPHTVFDVVNVNMLGKVNVLNLVNYNGQRKFFEPVVFYGIGWGHVNCSHLNTDRNYMVTKTGVELNFHLDKEKAWVLRMSPAAVWGTVESGKLNGRHGGFELTVGVAYHFKNSDGNRHYTKITPRSQVEIDMLNAALVELNQEKVTLTNENEKLREIAVKLSNDLENEKGKVRVDTVYVNLNTYEYFKVGSAEVLSQVSIRTLARSMDNTKHYVVVGYASEEGPKEFNDELSSRRAETVYNLLIKFGFPAENLEFRGEGPTTQFSTDDRNANRVVVVEQK